MLNKILDNLKSSEIYECYQIGTKIYTNKDLYIYVCNIYNYLEKNVERNTKVVVYGHKDIYMIASFLACAFYGVTYVPIDVSIPQDRKENIIKQVNPSLIIDEKISNIMGNNNYCDIDFIERNKEDVFYIIFTSGSTGTPKGVKIQYKNLNSCVKWLQKICSINEKEIIFNQANFSFDLSVADIYLSLVSRAKHFVVDRESQKDYGKLFENLKMANPELMVITPSFADLLLIDKSFNSELIPNLRKILFCGEMLKTKTVKKLKDRFENIEIINSYGPTECTFAVTSYVVDDYEKISIGNPKDDVEIYLVDENLNEVEEGKTGEILIVGESVGAGYLNSKLNENVFVSFNGKNGYLTGDLGYKEDGRLYCIGRKDKQIKYKGYRIELSEIENVINKLDFVEKSVVVSDKNKDGIVKRILAFIKLNKADISEVQVKIELEKHLPEYMIPNIKFVNVFPLTENGKIDEKKLMEEKNERGNN